MSTRGPNFIPRILFAVFLAVALSAPAWAWDGRYGYPVKVRNLGARAAHGDLGGIGYDSRAGVSDWSYAAGASRTAILCPKRGYSFELGMRPFFSYLTGSVKALSKGGEGSFLNLRGHLRIPEDKTLWEFYSNLRLWDKVTVRIEYMPWHWGGSGHAGTDGNFAGLLITQNDSLTTDLHITILSAGADYDVSFGRDLVFGPNADLFIIKWTQHVANDIVGSVDFDQTVIQPTIGGHIRYEPTNTGYFSWFKPYLEGRFGWMSFDGLSVYHWNMATGVAPPLSKNVDAGVRVGYKSWKMDGNRRLLYTDVGIEGLYFDFGLRF